MLTNNFDLPQPFVDAVSGDNYDRGDADYTATELIRPVRIAALQRKYGDEITEDVSERVWTLSGQARHIVLERIAKTTPARYFVEQRFESTLPGGMRVSGRIDLYDPVSQILYDFKETSVWKQILGDFTEWEQQANINLYLMRMHGFLPKQLLNISLLKDCKARKARLSKQDDYPKCAVHVVELPMWSVGQAQAYILERIRSHEEAREALLGGNDPLLCNKRERWQRDTGYAVMQKGRKRAIRVFDNLGQAEALKGNRELGAVPGEKFFIEERPMEPVRCLDFCPVWHWCDFGRKAKAQWEAKNGTES